MDAEKTDPHLVRLGLAKMIKFNPGQQQVQIFQFILESKGTVQIVPTVMQGNIKVSVGWGLDKESAFAET